MLTPLEGDDLGTTEMGIMRFGSSDVNPMRSIMAKEEEIKICFLHHEASDNEFFSASDISYHPWLMRKRAMFSSAHVNAALTRTMNDSFLNKIRVAGKQDEKWQE